MVLVVPKLVKELQLSPQQAEGAMFYTAHGCNDCHDTGYRGRTGIYEVLNMSPRIKKMILDRCSTTELKAAAVEEGMLTLRQDSLRKMLLGDTTPEEVLRETAAD